MILYITCVVLGLYSAGISIAVAHRLIKFRRLVAVAGLFGDGDDEVSEEEEAEYAARLKNPEIGVRERHREDLQLLWRGASDAARRAEKLGRRAGCLHVAAAELRGAYRNACEEDADALKDPSIVFEELQ